MDPLVQFLVDQGMSEEAAKAHVATLTAQRGNLDRERGAVERTQVRSLPLLASPGPVAQAADRARVNVQQMRAVQNFPHPSPADDVYRRDALHAQYAKAMNPYDPTYRGGKIPVQVMPGPMTPGPMTPLTAVSMGKPDFKPATRTAAEWKTYRAKLAKERGEYLSKHSKSTGRGGDSQEY